MANIVANVSLGQAVELYKRVDTGDPAAARLYIVPLSAGAVTDATARDVDDLAALIVAGFVERTANGWNRKTLDSAALVAFAPDDTNDRADLDCADQVWTAVSTDAVTDLGFFYASVASPTNAQLQFVTLHDFAVTPSGGDVTAAINVFFRATSAA